MRSTVALIVVLLLSPAGKAQDVSGLCDSIFGAAVVADDGTYLGTVASKFDANSLFNEFGQYGSKFSAKSIWNEFGKYGGAFSALSPFNEFTASPPILVKGGKTLARLTTNKGLRGAVSPHVLRACEF